MSISAVRASSEASIEALAGRVGSYIPHEAGMGGSYMSGSVRADPSRFASPDFPGVRSSGSGADAYVPSFEAAALSAPAREAASAESGVDEEAGAEFSPEERRIIDSLKARDREVRAHEQAHISAGGAYVRGGAAYEYQSGPDGRRYATGGEVGIDSSPVRDNPEATIAKMQVVRSAALAPVDPSPQDGAVAAAASREEARASAELRELRAEEARRPKAASVAAAYANPYVPQTNVGVVNFEA